ncbi:MAG: cellulose biosynthesis protein BcsQ [Pseudomonas sp.]|uniref:cellulose biosynthesis protein BcsQ n=1 Tax=Pseudomonas abieticivorans TaxID=2931382 RepID=UPI0020BF9A49|nr:cellulose biosynthesis protein BcsQ [Pseudomonas sp. PIA16]MDE1167868.1 cellulose biosynthesis protein BcsQ [Pseudomonas sp.]
MLRDLLTELSQQRSTKADRRYRQTAATLIALVSANGGTGKTTLAAGLAKTLQNPGARTLAIDLDPQGALPNHLGTPPRAPGLAQLLAPGDSWNTYCTPGYSHSECLGYGMADEAAYRTLQQQMLEDRDWLGRHLAGMDLGERDTVILDTPSGASEATLQAIQVADMVLVVSLADGASYLALDSLPQGLGARAPCTRHVLNQVDESRTFCEDMVMLFEQRLGSALIGSVRLDHQLRESLAYGRDPLLRMPQGIGCRDVNTLAGTLRELLGERAAQ